MYLLATKDQLRKVPEGFPVNHLDVERLLGNWRWLCPNKMRLVARGAFGDLFLCDEEGQVFWLDVGGGVITKLTDSQSRFQACLKVDELREHWFGERDEWGAATRGFVPDPDQCIAFTHPLVFKGSGTGNTIYLVDLYEGVSFLGDLHR
jgi:hypothetical protein